MKNKKEVLKKLFFSTLYPERSIYFPVLRLYGKCISDSFRISQRCVFQSEYFHDNSLYILRKNRQRAF